MINGFSTDELKETFQ